MKLQLFEGIGIELEYMIVDSSTLSIAPVADQLLQPPQGDPVTDLPGIGPNMEWSNELTRHVVEIKNSKPEPELSRLLDSFQFEVKEINRRLLPLGFCLMPTAMHPWMDPTRETQLWPHTHHEIYEQFHRLFNCYRHGWANLQSMHINLPFASDQEFRQLHSATRLVLPLLPALCASSPLVEGKFLGFQDSRLHYYLRNQERIPSILGKCIPDVSPSEMDYRAQVLKPIARELKPLDRDGWLNEEWVNSRGAIPKFERDSLEIRVADMQEAPIADLSVAWFVSKILKKLVHEELSSLKLQELVATDSLRDLFDQVIRNPKELCITHPPILQALGFQKPLALREIFEYFLNDFAISPQEDQFAATMKILIQKGPLATRILNVLDKNHFNIPEIYHELCACLNRGVLFEG